MTWKVLPCITAYTMINAKTMKHIACTLFIGLLFCLLTPEVKAQAIGIKSWNGYYPEMKGSYPMTFIAFKGWLFPEPHVFVRVWPTHYYLQTDAVPVTDEAGISQELTVGMMKIVTKAIERSQMKGRMEETERIRSNTDFTRQIGQKLFEARSDELSDIYNLASGFVALYQKISKLASLDKTGKIHSIYEGESDELLWQFLMVNLMQTDHGRKLEAYTAIGHQLTELLGEVDYTHGKLNYFNSYDKDIANSYSFLSD